MTTTAATTETAAAAAVAGMVPGTRGNIMAAVAMHGVTRVPGGILKNVTFVSDVMENT